MTAPTIGQTYTRKRGRPHLPAQLVIRQVHRADRLAEVRGPAGERHPSMPFRELARNYKALS